MVDHYADLSGEPLNWGWMMRQIAEHGLTNRMGKPPPLGTAKRTWFRVVAFMRARPVPPVIENRRSQQEAKPVPILQHQHPASFGFAVIKSKE